MNFYSVPAILYQQQQKLKRKSKKPTHKSSRKDSLGDDRSSLGSSTKSERLALDDDAFLTEDKTKLPGPSNKKTTSSSSSSSNSPSFARINSNKLGELVQNQSTKSSEVGSPRVSQDDYRRPSISSSMASFVSGKLGRAPKLQLSQSSTPCASSTHSIEISDTQQENVVHHQQEEPSPSLQIPDYIPIIDLSILNDSKTIERVFFNPKSLKQRFETFLSILSEHHINDPINFASVREQSLRSFAKRLKQSKRYRNSGLEAPSQGDINLHEDSMAYELLKMRSLLRTLVKDECLRLGKNPALNMTEELLHSNFYNYIRFLIKLPDLQPTSSYSLNDTQKKHYENRTFLHDMSTALHAQKKEGYEDEVTTFTSRMELLVQAILKSTHEFVLLEKYLIQILVKLNNDFLIESRITRKLFDLYCSKSLAGEKDSIKGLIINSFFSVNYAWYLAITIPFVRFFETSIFNEECTLDDSEASPKNSSKGRSLEDFRSTDEALFKDYFANLNLTDFNMFANMSRKKLVKLQESHIQSDQDLTPHNGKPINWRPANFEYYTKCLSNIADDTFNVIHIRDFQVQFASENYKRVLAELCRILKVGGFLEIPLLLSGIGTFTNSWDVFGDSYLFGPKVTEERDGKGATQASIKDLFLELSRIFGKNSVMFTTVLLTAKNEMNWFLINQTLFKSFDLNGNIDEYSDEFYENMDLEKGNMKYYVYIRVEKCER